MTTHDYQAALREERDAIAAFYRLGSTPDDNIVLTAKAFCVCCVYQLHLSTWETRRFETEHIGTIRSRNVARHYRNLALVFELERDCRMGLYRTGTKQ